MSEIATEKKVTPPQRRAIAALLTTGDTTQAAIAAGVNRSTLYAWRAQPHFQEALKEAEADAVAGLSRSLAGLGESAAQALRDALAPGNKMNLRLRAAEIVTDRLLKLRDLVELEERIAALERGQ